MAFYGWITNLVPIPILLAGVVFGLVLALRARRHNQRAMILGIAGLACFAMYPLARILLLALTYLLSDYYTIITTAVNILTSIVLAAGMVLLSLAAFQRPRTPASGQPGQHPYGQSQPPPPA